MEFERFKKFWEKPEERVVTSNNVSSWDSFWDKLVSNEDNFSIPSVSNTRESLIKTSPHTCVSDALDESRTYYYERIDMEIINKVIITSSPKEKITWIDMAEKECIEDYKQKTIDTILMGDYKKEMKMNRVELEMQHLREGTGENYMLNKMINTDGVNFFVEYTLYKDYNKYFGLTLDGESINIIDIMEEEFAEFLSHYRLSAMYPQIEAVHEDTWDITPEENEAIKKQMESGKTDQYIPVYDENDIEDKIEVGSDLDIDKPNIVQSMWTETSTNTGKDYAKPWTETSINTNPDCIKPWGGCYPSGSGTISVGSGTISVAPETFYISDTENKSDQEKLAESVKFIESLLAQEKQVETKNSPNILKNTENKSGAELITKVISDIIKELFTEGTCSINITLK